MIETARLVLRWPEVRDHAALHAMWADPAVMADLGPVKNAAASDATIARHGGYRDTHGLGFWIVESKADGGVAGFCGLKPGAPGTPIAGRVEVGWMLAVPYWGLGLAREAAEASLRWAWAERGADAVFAITAARNGKSRGLMERLGMRHLPGADFAHPAFAAGDPLRDSVVYRINASTSSARTG